MTSLDGITLKPVARVAPVSLEGLPHTMLLDLRNKNEFAEGHLGGRAGRRRHGSVTLRDYSQQYATDSIHTIPEQA